MKFRSFFCVAAFISATAVSVAMGQAVDLDAGLFLRYSFENTSNLGEDSSGNDYHGTVAGTTSYVTAEEGVYSSGGLGLDVADPMGTSYGYINVPTPDPAVVPTEAVTICAWVNLFRVFNSPTDKERNTIFSTMAAPNGASTSKGTGGLTLDIRGRVTDVGAVDPVLSVGYRTVFRGADVAGERNQHPIVDFEYGTVAVLDGNEQPTGEIEYYTPISDLVGQWVHMCSTYDKATATAALYINGEKVYDLPVLEAIDIDTDWDKAQVGKFVEGGRELRGYMDDLRVYTRALNADEVAALAYRLPGDANIDGKVDDEDAATMASNWLSADATWAMGDFTGDGIINESDATVLAANWQTGAGGSASVPEPSTLAIIALGCLVLIGRRSLRK